MLFSIQTFEQPLAFLLLLFLPVFYVLKYKLRSSREPAQASPDIRFFKGKTATGDAASPSKNTMWNQMRFIFKMNASSPRFWTLIVSKMCILVAGIALIMAAARPYGDTIYDVRAEGIDIFLVLDMSGSMRSLDENIEIVRQRAAENNPVPNRFENAIRVLTDFVEEREMPCHNPDPGKLPRCDRIGMVAFAQEAYLQFPLTTDYQTIRHILSKSQLGDINGSMTAIGDAIARAVAGLRHSNAKSKTIVLITDGEQNGGNVSVAQAIEAAQTYKIPVYTILVGKNSRAVVDLGYNGQHDFQYISIGTDWPLLQEIAQKTGGTPFQTESMNQVAGNLHEILNQLEKNISQNQWDANHVDLAPDFIRFAFALILIAMFLRFLFVRQWP